MYARPSGGPSAIPVSSGGPSGGPSGMQQQVPVYTPAPTYSTPVSVYSAPSRSIYSSGGPAMYSAVPVYTSPTYVEPVCCDARVCVIL
ncbi:MAG: hypothetical protein ACYCQI_08735 [Gammaproteobacteria bacterium]